MVRRGEVTGEHETRDAVETEALGRRLGEILEPGEIIILTGDLGAGKTTFVRGLAAGIGSPCHVSSPTFVRERLYQGRLPLLHIDLYREAESVSLAMDDAVAAGAAIAVEWGERLDREWQRDATIVRFRFVPDEGGDRRVITILRGGKR